jgi:hypothetical protein
MMGQEQTSREIRFFSRTAAFDRVPDDLVRTSSVRRTQNESLDGDPHIGNSG